MFYTHHFAHHETLSRAHNWLTRLGFNPKKVETQASGIPRIVLSVEAQRLDAVRVLINAAERNDPDGFLSFWDEARMPHAHVAKRHPEEMSADRPVRQSTAIGWHPLAD